MAPVALRMVRGRGAGCGSPIPPAPCGPVLKARPVGMVGSGKELPSARRRAQGCACVSVPTHVRACTLLLAWATAWQSLQLGKM